MESEVFRRVNRLYPMVKCEIWAQNGAVLLHDLYDTTVRAEWTFVGELIHRLVICMHVIMWQDECDTPQTLHFQKHEFSLMNPSWTDDWRTLNTGCTGNISPLTCLKNLGPCPRTAHRKTAFSRIALDLFTRSRSPRDDPNRKEDMPRGHLPSERTFFIVN